MSSNTVLGWTNLVKSAALTAGSAEVRFPIQNIQNDIGTASLGWQTTAGVITSGGGATCTITPLIAAQTWRVFVLAGTNLTPGASVTFAVYNNPTTLVYSVTVAGPAPGYRQVVVVAPVDKTADYCTVSITDADNPDGFINVPLVYAGPVWVPAVGINWQTTFGRDSQIDETRSRGGQEYPIPRWQQRRWEIAMDGIQDSELWTDAQELDRVSRFGGNVVFIPDITSTTIGNEAVFGRVESVADVSFVSGITQLFSWKFRIRERL